jgi:type VI secretion system secreted protein Hcp
MAQADYFLKLDGINGESQDSVHTNEIQLSSISWGVSNSGSGGFGMGSGSSKSSVMDMQVTKTTDLASPNLWAACCSGKSIGDAVLTMRKAGGDAPVEYLVFNLTEVFVTSHTGSGHDGGGIAQESVSLNFSKIKITYTPQNPDGSPGASIDKTYDVKANEVS